MAFSTSSSNGAPNDAVVIAGGVSGRRLKVLKTCHLPRFLSEAGGLFSFLVEDLRIDDFHFRIRLISLDGYSLRSQGLETIRQALMIVTSDSIIVHMVVGIRLSIRMN